jgi:formylmethanofuran dehydrogenase subunit D
MTVINNMKLNLNTSRKLDNDQAYEQAFGDNASLKENLAVAFLNPLDLKKLNIKSDTNVKVSNDSGSVIVKCKIDKKLPQGMILMPVSIWANQITFTLNDDLIYKNITVEIEPTEEKILNYDDLIQKFKRGAE